MPHSHHPQETAAAAGSDRASADIDTRVDSIVRTAEDALFVLKNSGLEHMQVGDYLVHKPQG